MICAFAFNAYSLSNVKEGYRGCGPRSHRSSYGGLHSYSRDRGWVYGRGYYNSGHYLDNDGETNSWLLYPSIFSLYPRQQEIIVRPYQSVYYA